MMNTPTQELMVVMPVFNEQASVRKVVTEWFHEIQNWTENFVFLAINDGSTDETQRLLERLADQLGERFEVINQSNAGHGQACLRGYREACGRRFPFVFQIDSDGQCDPQFFFKFWRERNRHDVLYGVRHRREDGWRRVVASVVLRLFLLVTTGANCRDANVPYRLMRTQHLEALVNGIPKDFFLANVALAVLLQLNGGWKTGYVPIRFRERYGGEPSVGLHRFGQKAGELWRQLRAMRIRS
jgi:glycosyltransferase involved in cell wall biosynthesis